MDTIEINARNYKSTVNEIDLGLTTAKLRENNINRAYASLYAAISNDGGNRFDAA